MSRQLSTRTNDVAHLPEDPVSWIEREFYIPETTGPIRLEPYQRQVVREALRRDAAGSLLYSLVLYSDLKKSAKSTIAAAVVLYLAWHHAWETCRVVANDLKQADSRTFFYIRRAVELNPRLSQLCQIKNYKITLPNRTTIEAIPVDPKGEAGGGDLIVCFTELWAAKNEAAKRLWTETTLSPLKYGKSLRWCETYAGFEGESPILETLYASGVAGGQRIDDDLELYVNRGARMLTLWNTQPRCYWQTPDYYAQEAATLTPTEFLRVHRNQWGASTNAFVPLAWWDACRGELPEDNPRESWVIAADAAVSGDCFAVVGVTVRRSDGKLVVRYARRWTPPSGGKIDFGAPDGPEAEIERLCRARKVVQVCYDPYQLHDMMTRLQRKGLTWFDEFNQNAPRLVADKQLYDLIRDGRVLHDGHAHLDEHIQNANREEQGDNKLRLVKRNESLKIDLAVALSMACARALELGI